ncbi:MAG: hypothetical protein ACEQSA_00440 [Weeksellaceae bacterium]
MAPAKKKNDTPTEKKPFVIPGFKQSLWLLVAIAFITLVANIYASQFMPDFYYQMVAGNRKGAVEFYRQARSLQSFQFIQPETTQTIAGYTDEIEVENRRRDELIVELEELLSVNPKSRDVLQSLVILYEQRGDEVKAQEYKQKLFEVDPTSLQGL